MEKLILMVLIVGCISFALAIFLLLLFGKKDVAENETQGEAGKKDAGGKRFWHPGASIGGWIAGAVVVGLIIAVTVYFLPNVNLENLPKPSLAGVSAVVQDWWLWFVLGTVAILIILPKLVEKHEYYSMLVLGVALVFLVVLPMWIWISSSPRTDEIEWVGDLTIPPNGKSELVPKDPGMYVVMSADDEFVNHTVYADGTECAYNGTQCPDGIVSGNYAENKTSKTIIVSYGYAK